MRARRLCQQWTWNCERKHRYLMNKKMLFKIGLTIIILTAWYMYYAITKLDSEKQLERTETEVKRMQRDERDKDGVQKNHLDVKVVSGMPEDKTDQKHRSNTEHWKRGLHLAVVSCGDRLEESMVLLKSAVLFSHSKLIFHIFADELSQKGFKEQLDFWPPVYRAKVQYYIYDLWFPKEEKKKDDWKALFKLCASQRLFLPDLLPDVDSLLYVDTDVLFLSPVDKIWALFSQFNATQLAGVTPEHEDKQTGWYNRFARHPYYGELGVNSGVMLMNLTRIRSTTWIQSLKNFNIEYRYKITYGDQDLINIYFHFHPDQIYVFPCEWNYRPDHCMYMSVCKRAERVGAYILHGNRRVWHTETQPAFRDTYRIFKEHRLGASIQYDLLETLDRALEDPSMPSNCGKLKTVFKQQIQIYVEQKKDR